ncbi:unnamed protein product [Mytilus edulis]|uniref:G-protein coupled receptors family 1 profile domain-containing protein n=1 Tax=Mytilus edulis TaxID=6550 RepID=A0A8S3PQG6_MYTED|nr:unnamed protein product [Mytilus edulis]
MSATNVSFMNTDNNQTLTDRTQYGDITAEQYIEGILLTFICLVSVLGNISIWIIVLRSRALRTITNCFLLVLSAFDLLVSFINIPVTILTIFSGEWFLSDGACIVFGFTNMVTLCGSVLSLCNISINRYVMVCHPSKFIEVYKRKNVAIMIIASIAVTIGVSVPPLLGWCEYSYTPSQYICFAKWPMSLSYSLFMICCCFGVPLVVMIFCNYKIYRTVKISKNKIMDNYTVQMSISKDESESTLSDNTGQQGIRQERNQRTGIGNQDLNIETQFASNKSNRILSTSFQFKTSSPKLPVVSKVSKTKPEEIRLAIMLDSKDQQKESIEYLPCTNVYVKRSKWKQISRKNNVLGIRRESNQQRCIGNLNTKSEGQSDVNKKHRALSSTIKTRASPPKRPVVNKANPEEIRLAIMLVTIVIVFFICWFPYCITAIAVTICVLVPPLIGWCKYSYTPAQYICFDNCPMSLLYSLFKIYRCFGVPHVVMIVCNYKIYRIVKTSKNKIMDNYTVKMSMSKDKSEATLSDNTGNQGIGQELKHSRIGNSDLNKETQIDVNKGHRILSTSFQIKITPPKLPVVSKVSKTKPEEIRLAIMLGTIVVVFLVCWFPYCISMILRIVVPVSPVMGKLMESVDLCLEEPEVLETSHPEPLFKVDELDKCGIKLLRKCNRSRSKIKEKNKMI